MPSHMICGVMLTMCAWRMRRRFTMPVICMRDCSSLGCTCTAKTDTWLCSISAAMAAGKSTSGRGASSSSMNAR